MPSPFPYIWYKFDTISSSKVINSGSAGATLDATLYNGASVINNENANPIGSTCLNLQNTPNKLCSDSTGQYLSIPPFTLGGPFSFSCWFKKDNKNTNYTFRLTLGSNLKTLKVEEVNSLLELVAKELKDKIGAKRI